MLWARILSNNHNEVAPQLDNIPEFTLFAPGWTEAFERQNRSLVNRIELGQSFCFLHQDDPAQCSMPPLPTQPAELVPDSDLRRGILSRMYDGLGYIVLAVIMLTLLPPIWLGRYLVCYFSTLRERFVVWRNWSIRPFPADQLIGCLEHHTRIPARRDASFFIGQLWQYMCIILLEAGRGDLLPKVLPLHSASAADLLADIRIELWHQHSLLPRIRDVLCSFITNTAENHHSCWQRFVDDLLSICRNAPLSSTLPASGVELFGDGIITFRNLVDLVIHFSGSLHICLNDHDDVQRIGVALGAQADTDEFVSCVRALGRLKHSSPQLTYELFGCVLKAANQHPPIVFAQSLVELARWAPLHGTISHRLIRQLYTRILYDSAKYDWLIQLDFIFPFICLLDRFVPAGFRFGEFRSRGRRESNMWRRLGWG
jgi:hypothetical protein